MNAEQKKDLFLRVEKMYLDYYYQETRRVPNRQQKMNLCCNKQDERDIIAMGDHIKDVFMYSRMSLQDIYVVLIYVYYSLRYNEQTDYEWLSGKFLVMNTMNPTLSKQLLYEIIAGDIIVNTQNFTTENLSSAIRKRVLGISSTGGNKKRRNHKTKRCKHKKRTLNNR